MMAESGAESVRVSVWVLKILAAGSSGSYFGLVEICLDHVHLFLAADHQHGPIAENSECERWCELERLDKK